MVIFCKKTSFNEQEGPFAPGAPSGGVGLLVLALLLVLLLLLHRRRREAVYDLHDDDGDVGFEQRRDLLAAAVGLCLRRRLLFGLLLQHVHFGEQPHDRLADLAAAGHAQRHHDLVIPLPFEAPEQQQVMLRMVTLSMEISCTIFFLDLAPTSSTRCQCIKTESIFVPRILM